MAWAQGSPAAQDRTYEIIAYGLGSPRAGAVRFANERSGTLGARAPAIYPAQALIVDRPVGLGPLAAAGGASILGR